MEYVKTAFGDVEVRDSEGRVSLLRELWSRKPCVLVFVRQYGCVVCRSEASDWKTVLPRIRDAGADLAIIGNGPPASAGIFREDLRIGDLRVYSDETRRSYELAGFRRGLWTLLSPRAIRNYIRAYLTGHRGSRTAGDALQQGGVMVVCPDGRVPFRYANQRSGDHADPEQVLAALQGSAETS